MSMPEIAVRRGTCERSWPGKTPASSVIVGGQSCTCDGLATAWTKIRSQNDGPRDENKPGDGSTVKTGAVATGFSGPRA